MIIFDCDGVLVDSEIISNRIDAEAFTAAGYPITMDDMIRRFIGRPKKDIWALVEAEFGKPFPQGMYDKANADVLARYPEELEAIAGVAEAVLAIGDRRCVASSSEMGKLRLGLSVTGLIDLFEPNIFSAAQVARGKPAPDLFLFAAERTGAAPQECIVVEDSVPGVVGARAAGMRVIGFIGGGHSYEGHADALREAGAERVVAHMDALAETVGEMRD